MGNEVVALWQHFQESPFKSMYSHTHAQPTCTHSHSFHVIDAVVNVILNRLLVLIISHKHLWKEGSEEMNLISCFPCFGKWAGS